MEFKGTKGNWKPSKQRGQKGSCILAQVFCDEEYLLSFKATEIQEEASYNALLVSKAPEMLEMLKQIDDEGYDFCDWGGLDKLIKEATEL